MLFNSVAFAVFLAIVLPLYYVLDHRWQNRMLLVASYVFYGWWDWRFLFLLWFSTIVDYTVARRMGALREDRKRRRLMWLSVGLNLCYLGFFKYFNFFADSARTGLEFFGLHADFFTLRVLLPIGISFYTFQSISYIVDVYRNDREHTNDFVGFALYLAYFPHLVAGPIQRSTQLLPQLLAPRRVEAEQIKRGLVLMLVGFFKKVAIADAVGPTVDLIFSRPDHQSSAALLIGLYLFAIQIYADFSGYTDIARGVSRLMGIELRLNFRQPYLSANITEFWRRWHMSLSEWLRDYLYIPLGGNRRGARRTYLNLFITMFLGGLWHGAAWTFVAWGSLHGMYLAIHKQMLHARKAVDGLDLLRRGRRVRFAVGVVVTFHLVCLAWIFFRARTFRDAWAYVAGLASLRGPLPSSFLVLMVYSAFLMLLVDIPSWLHNEELPVKAEWPALSRGLAYGMMLGILFWVGSPHGAPFIYFQF